MGDRVTSGKPIFASQDILLPQRKYNVNDMQSIDLLVLAPRTVLGGGGVQCKHFAQSWYSVGTEPRWLYLISSAVENAIKLSLERDGTQFARPSLPLTPVISDAGTRAAQLLLCRTYFQTPADLRGAGRVFFCF